MNEILGKITAPVAKEMKKFNDLFAESLSQTDGLLNQVLEHIRQRGGKRMRPMLTLLIAKHLYMKEHGDFYRDMVKVKNILSSNEDKKTFAKALRAATSLELLHTASLIHDDVVDESNERRGQASVNASYDNRIAVLVGDYVLSTSLSEIAKAQEPRMTQGLARLGMTLSEGEVRQQQNISNTNFSIDDYYDVISKKTAALFESCCYLGALSIKASEEEIVKACKFGHNLGIIFQIRDDIFDYSDSKEIGKPTGNDMREGKLTLPALFVLNDADCPEHITLIGKKVRTLAATPEDIATLIEYTKEHGGINHANLAMDEYYQKALQYVNEEVVAPKLKEALKMFLDYVIGREI